MGWENSNGAIEKSSIWFALGLLNNTPYLVMLASAKYISEGGTAVVYIANTVPGLLIKLSSPYWFDRVHYRVRLTLASFCMALAFGITAYYCREESLSMTGQLVGVALVSIQIGMGEASLLALAGKLDSSAVDSRSSDEQSLNATTSSDCESSTNRCLLCFSSGTGLAGPIGYLWKVSLTEWLGWSVSSMLLAGVLLAALYLAAFFKAINGNASSSFQHQLVPSNNDDDDYADEQEMVPYRDNEATTTNIARHRKVASLDIGDEEDREAFTVENHCNLFSSDHDVPRSLSSFGIPVVAVPDMTLAERFRLVLSLWPYIIPLFTVYAAEYACQAGAWTAIGFPTMDSVEARAQFYEQSNWLYQAGSFISRSSGGFMTVSLSGLWLIPLLQVINLIFFCVTAARHGFFYQRGILLTGSFYTGLLGGAVYVHGYKRIVEDMPRAHTEFALSSTCVAEALGVLMADIIGLFIQSCLYSRNGVSGAVVKCPL